MQTEAGTILSILVWACGQQDHWNAEEGSRESCDSQCRKLTASWVREAKANNPDIETCQFYEGLEAVGAEGVMDAGV